MSYALKSALGIVAAAALTVGLGSQSAEARCRTCKAPSKTIVKTQYKYSTVRQVRNVSRYKDVYRIHYFVKVSKTVSRAEFMRFKQSCKGACALAGKR